MGNNWLKRTIFIFVFLLIGLTSFTPINVNALKTYNPVKKPMEVLPLFFYDPPVNYYVYGHSYLNNITSLDLSQSKIDNELKDYIRLFRKLKHVDLRNHTFTMDEIKELKEEFPYIQFDFTIMFNGKEYDTTVEELDFNHIKVEDLDEFKNTLRLFTNLKKLDMSYSNLSNEQLGALREEFPNVQIDWVLFLSKWRFRTDVKSFSVLVYHIDYVKIKSQDLEVFKYCWNLEYLDLGHQAITDVSLIAKYLPDLRLLILADNRISDISPLASLTKLHYLELFINPIHDISALSGMKELVDINLCYDRIKDFSPLYDLPMLERIWLVGTGVNQNSIKELRAHHPNAQIVYTGGGSTNAGYRTIKRYYEMLKMFKDRYYVSTEFTKYDQDVTEDKTKHNYLNETVDVVVDHKIGTSSNNIVYLTNYGHLKSDKNVKVHILGEFTGINNYKGKVIAIIRRSNEDILVVSNANYSNDAINALVEYKEKNSKYQLIT